MVIGKKLKNINEENNFFYLTLALVILLLGSAMAQVVGEGTIEHILPGVHGSHVHCLFCQPSL